MHSMKAVIFHGTMGSPSSNWFPWLENKLTLKGWEATTPSFPTPLQIIKNGGHLNSETGYTEFPYLLDIIND